MRPDNQGGEVGQVAGAGALVAEPPLPVGAPPARRGAARSPGQIAWSRLRRDRVALAGAVFIVILVIFALCAPLFESLTGHNKDDQDTLLGLDDNGLPLGPLTNGYSVGSDQLGRDLLVRAAFGARTSLIIGVTATVLTLSVALVAGIVAGYFGGWVDGAISRFIDVVAAFPFLLFAIAMSKVLGASLPTVVFVIAFFSWFYTARVFRSEILALREREFIEAARALGASNYRIMTKHLFPHLIGSLIVYGTLTISASIGFEAALSFLGFGLPASYPSWGRMISDAVPGGRYHLAPMMMVVPGTLLFLTVLAFNLLGDGLRDAFDPRGGGR